MTQLNDMGDGGPAFPNTIRIDNEEFALLRGMSLRDYFAAQALAGTWATWKRWPKDGDVEWVAEHAYRCADAMLKARTA